MHWRKIKFVKRLSEQKLCQVARTNGEVQINIIVELGECFLALIWARSYHKCMRHIKMNVLWSMALKSLSTYNLISSKDSLIQFPIKEKWEIYLKNPANSYENVSLILWVTLYTEIGSVAEQVIFATFKFSSNVALEMVRIFNLYTYVLIRKIFPRRCFNFIFLSVFQQNI